MATEVELPGSLAAEPQAEGRANAITASAFARRMQAFAPFEPSPTIAVAVSGGPDSLALTLLLHDWVQANGGELLALTVDHGLRPEASAEAHWVGEVLGARGIAHRILSWQGPKPDRVHQQHAREERYARLRDACADAGVLHLALAHHRDDRAETVLLRVRSGSQLDGIAGMAHQREMPELRLIRPLLDCRKAELRATCRAYGLSWVEDPTNEDPSYMRGALRHVMPVLAETGLTIPRINAFAGLIGRARQHFERGQDALLARSVWMHPAGFAWLDPEPLRTVPDRVGRGVLARVLLTVGGQVYAPRSARLERLYEELRQGLDATRTLGGCQIVPRREQLLVVREWETVPALPIAPGESLVFDGRFGVRAADEAPHGLSLAPIGRDGWANLTQSRPALRDCAVPPPARPALTGLFDADGLACVPALPEAMDRGCGWLHSIRLAPRRALTGAGFTVAQDEFDII